MITKYIKFGLRFLFCNFILILIGCAGEQQSIKDLGSVKLDEASMIIEAIQADLYEVNQIISDEGLAFEVGITSVSGLPIEEIAGEAELTNEENDSIQNLMLEKSDKELATISQGYIEIDGELLVPSMRKLDLRDFGLVTEVKDQLNSGSCWAFGFLAAYESNFNVINSLYIDGSEQHVINCSSAGTATSGGLAFKVGLWMVENKKNVDSELNFPFYAIDGPCSLQKPETDYFAIEWGFVDSYQNPSSIPSVNQIKEAICKYGVISASVYVSKPFQYYTGGVFKENLKYNGTNHAIAIVGWDDDRNAWIVKNSWGKRWGESCSAENSESNSGGYMWIDYNSNNIGRRALWVRSMEVEL